MKTSIQFSFIGSIAGLAMLFIMNGLKFECTPFSLIMAVISTVNGFAYTFCTFKALGIINLSLYSLFSMLGGMVLPFFQGIVFFGEKFTFAKLLCMVLVTFSLLLTVKKDKRKKGTIPFLGVFVLNGMSGVLSKIFVAAPFEKVSPAGYSVLCGICSLILSFFFLVLLSRKKETPVGMTTASVGISVLSGILNKLANFLLIVALAHVDASVQYPMVTGGVMIVSTAVCFLEKKKPSKREILSVFIAFLGMLFLFAIPE
ncbi:MAG: hypothetical protein ACI3XN_07245 [Eubacteriales bacterium]